VGHVGDGNFHEAIMYHRDDPEESARVNTHVRKMISKALEMEGTSSVRFPFHISYSSLFLAIEY
jgi:D-lactate dehydrogenase (cytochrome)